MPPPDAQTFAAGSVLVSRTMRPSERQEILSRRLHEARRRSGLSVPAAAERISRGRSTLQEWESGRTNPTAVDLAALADVYGCSADWLLGRDAQSGFLAAIDSRLERHLLNSQSPDDFDTHVPLLACAIHEDTIFEFNPVALGARVIKVLDHGRAIRRRLHGGP